MKALYVNVSIGFKGDLETAVSKLLKKKKSLQDSIFSGQNYHDSNTDDAFVT